MRDEEKPNYFGIMPAYVRYSQVAPMAKILFTEVSALSNKYGYCTASNLFFSRLYGKSERSVSRWLAELESIEAVICEYENTQKGSSRRIYPRYDIVFTGVDKFTLDKFVSRGVDKNGSRALDKTVYHNNTSITNTYIEEKKEEKELSFKDFWNTWASAFGDDADDPPKTLAREFSKIYTHNPQDLKKIKEDLPLYIQYIQENSLSASPINYLKNEIYKQAGGRSQKSKGSSGPGKVFGRAAKETRGRTASSRNQASGLYEVENKSEWD